MMKSTGVQRGAWTVVGLLWVVAMLNYLDRTLIVNMGPPIEADLQITDTAFGLFSSVFLWVYAGCSLFAGFIADRFGHRRVILFSVVVWSAATLWTGLAPDFQWMLIARAVMGISEAFYLPAALALVVEFHRGSTRARATGLHMTGIYVGSILGGLGGWMATHFDWRLSFQVFGVFGILYGLFLAFVLKDPPPFEGDEDGAATPEQTEQPRLGAALAALLGSRSFICLMLAGACIGTAGWLIITWTPMFLERELNVSLTLAGIYAAIFSAAKFGGVLLGSDLSDRLAMRNPRARALIPAVAYCVAAPAFFFIGVNPTVIVVLTAISLYGIAQGFMDSNQMPAVCTVVDNRYRATAYGLLNFTGTSIGGLIAFMGGWLKDAHVPFATIFQGASLFVLGAGLFLFAVKPGFKKQNG